MKAGVPDVIICVPNDKYHGLFIEFKSPGNKATELQSNMMKKLVDNGYHCCICFSWHEARDIVKIYLGEKLSRERS